MNDVSDVPARQRLWSSSRHHLDVPRHLLSTYGRWAFSIAGPFVWNSLPVELRDPDTSIGSFRQSLKTWLFSKY